MMKQRIRGGLAQLPLPLEVGREKEVLFRKLVPEIPSTTYATFGLYRYPAKFIPQVIAYVLKNYARSGMSVFDPFAGYGTMGIVARVYGHDYEMWDLNPILEYLHNVATMDFIPEIDVITLVSQMATCQKEFVPDWSNLNYWYPQEFLPFLSKVWGFYHTLDDEQVKRVLLIPLLKATRYFSYNDERVHKLYSSQQTKKG